MFTDATLPELEVVMMNAREAFIHYRGKSGIDRASKEKWGVSDDACECIIGN